MNEAKKCEKCENYVKLIAQKACEIIYSESLGIGLEVFYYHN